MLQVNLLVVDRIQPQSNEFAMGVENEATGVSKLNDSLLWSVLSSCFSFVFQFLHVFPITCWDQLKNWKWSAADHFRIPWKTVEQTVWKM